MFIIINIIFYILNLLNEWKWNFYSLLEKLEVVVNINMVNYITFESSYKNLSIYCSNSRVTLYFVAIWSSNFFQSSPVPRSQAPKIFQELPSPTLQELLHRLQCEAKTLTTVKHHIKQETSKWRQLSRKWTVLNHGRYM